MLSQAEADRCIEDVGEEYRRRTYDELSALMGDNAGVSTTLDRRIVIGEHTVYANIMLSHLGRLRKGKRICVECVLSAEGGQDWARTPCVYFERYQTGRIWEMSAREETVWLFVWYFWLVLMAAVVVIYVLRWVLS